MSKQHLRTRHCLDLESATPGTSSVATQASKCMLYCFYKTNLGWNDSTFWVAQSFNFLSETRVVEGFLSSSFSPGSTSLPHSGPKPSSVQTVLCDGGDEADSPRYRGLHRQRHYARGSFHVLCTRKQQLISHKEFGIRTLSQPSQAKDLALNFFVVAFMFLSLFASVIPKSLQQSPPYDHKVQENQSIFMLFRAYKQLQFE